MPLPNDGSHSTFSSNAISVPGIRQTATCGSPTAAKPRVIEFLNLVVTSLSWIWQAGSRHGVNCSHTSKALLSADMRRRRGRGTLEGVPINSLHGIPNALG